MFNKKATREDLKQLADTLGITMEFRKRMKAYVGLEKTEKYKKPAEEVEQRLNDKIRKSELMIEALYEKLNFEAEYINEHIKAIKKKK